MSLEKIRQIRESVIGWFFNFWLFFLFLWLCIKYFICIIITAPILATFVDAKLHLLFLLKKNINFFLLLSQHDHYCIFIFLACNKTDTQLIFQVYEVVPCHSDCSQYIWVTEPWSVCKVTNVDLKENCGEGVQTRKVR